MKLLHSIKDDMFQAQSILTSCQSTKKVNDWFRKKTTHELIMELSKDATGRILPVELSKCATAGNLPVELSKCATAGNPLVELSKIEDGGSVSR